MTVQQISIFVENKSGTLLRVLELFKEARIQLIASTISDTVEYGIYRIICAEPVRALETLRGRASPPTCLRSSQSSWTTSRVVPPMPYAC